MKIYSIGEISKMVKISSDTLRYYDEIQLLNPDYINPSNNYRFYNENQVKELLYIMELKDCGFNLEEIKKILKLKDETKIKKLFEKKKIDLSVQSKKINSSIEIIEHKLKLMEDNYMKNKILIVDDAEFMRMMLKDILTKNGYDTIIEAENGADGIEKFKAEQPALVIMDISMPKMDGIDATREIKKIDSDAKIFMLSALGQPTFIAQSFIAGAVDFLVKPFQADFLVRFVQKHLTENVKLDIDEVKLWQAGDSKPYDVVKKIEFDSKKMERFTAKMQELLKECIDESSGINYGEMAAKLCINVVNDTTLNPMTIPSEEKLTQDGISSLVTRFTKG